MTGEYVLHESIFLSGYVLERNKVGGNKSSRILPHHFTLST